VNLLEYPKKLLRFDWFLMLVAISVSLVSLAIIRSATWASDEPGLLQADRKQFVWLLVATLACLTVALFDYRIFGKFFVLFGLAGVALLVITLEFASEIQGSKSWIILGPFSVQPAEFTKVSFIITLGGFLAWRGKKCSNTITFFGSCLITIIFMALIFAQGDTGTALVFAPMAFVMMFVAGVSLLWFTVSIISAAAASVFAYFFLLPDYARERIMTFLDPSRDPTDSGYHILESLRAIISGDWAGKGYMQGVGTITGRLPKNVSHTDFIFPVIAEEHGFLGAGALILAYTLIIALGIRIALLANDRFGTIMAAGVVALLFTHIYQNIGMTMNMMPVTGIPLPFVSYGGSFLITCFLALGLLQSINIHRKPSLKTPLL
jgi:rod shape determining protein RodA